VGVLSPRARVERPGVRAPVGRPSTIRRHVLPHVMPSIVGQAKPGAVSTAPNEERPIAAASGPASVVRPIPSAYGFVLSSSSSVRRPDGGTPSPRWHRGSDPVTAPPSGPSGRRSEE
jgi:hypothetical protein